MGTAPYSIANESGAQFRADVNTHLAAIVSNNSSATAPSPTFAYMWWADTTNGLLKQRNAANSAWVTIGALGSANLGLLVAANNFSDIGSPSTARTNLGLGTSSTADIDTDSTFAANSDTKVPSQKAVKTAVAALLPTAGGTLTGAIAMSGAAINEAQGADIASASTVNLEAATGNYVNITGTTTITTITLSQGHRRKVKFAGALTLTNGSNLILLSGANITTVAGDIAEFVGEASSVVRMVSYERADGTALVAASSNDIVKLTTATASSSTSVDFTSSITSTYRAYMFVIEDLVAATDDVALWMRVSEDAGSNWKAGASDYAYAGAGRNNSGALTIGSAGAAQIGLIPSGGGSGLGNAAGKALSGTVFLHNPSGSGKHKHVQSHLSYRTSGGETASMPASGSYIGTTNAVNAARFLLSSGNITSGTITMFGIK
jgi:hypothetical protein